MVNTAGSSSKESKHEFRWQGFGGGCEFFFFFFWKIGVLEDTEHRLNLNVEHIDVEKLSILQNKTNQQQYSQQAKQKKLNSTTLLFWKPK